LPLLNSILIIVCLLAGTVNASETQHFFFKHGFTAPYNQEYVNDVLYEPIDVTSKISPFELTFKDSPLITLTQFNFYLFQALDVYSTYRGLKYSCVSEANPFVFGGQTPSVTELVLFKVITIGLIKSIYDDEMWPQIQAVTNYTSSIAVANNFRVISDAKDYCPK
jgi:hypothetical protein